MNKQMTRDEIQRSESNGGRMPARFTGVWKGVHYYMGEVWTGPTNAIGHGKRLAREGKRIGPTNGNGDRHDRSPQKFGSKSDLMWSGCFSALAKGI